MTNMSDAVGTSAFGYTSAGALAFEDGPWGSSRVTYNYTLGQLMGLTVGHLWEGDWQQTYTYDSARRLKTTTSPAGTSGYNYAGAGRMVTNLALGNGTGIQNTFDALARLTATRLTNSSGTELNSHTYLYDQGGRRTNAVRVDGSYVRYKYDDIGQVKVAQGFESNGTVRVHEQSGYTYDAAGNLNYRTNNALTQTFNVNNLNELTTATRSGNMTVAGATTMEATSVTVADNGNSPVSALRYGDRSFARTNVTLLNGNNTFVAVAQDALSRTDTHSVTASLPSTVNFVYDLNGNLLTDGNRHFSYNDENQLTTAIVTNATKSEFTYDGKMRRRIRKESVWQNLTRGNDLSGTRQGAGGIGGLLARTDNLQTGTRKHACFHADGNGNVTMLTDSLQLVAAKYLYDAFGHTLAAVGPLAEANFYRFSSKEFHLTSGLVYYLYRYYEPQLQRWVNRDPILENGGINLHRFCGNAATTGIDLFGLSLAGMFNNFDVPRRYPPPPPPAKNPNLQAAKNWLKKCIPQLCQNSFGDIPIIPSDLFPVEWYGTALLPGVIIVNSSMNKSIEDYVATIAHECMHKQLGGPLENSLWPRAIVGNWNGEHDEIEGLGSNIAIEYSKDPDGKKCCK